MTLQKDLEAADERILRYRDPKGLKEPLFELRFVHLRRDILSESISVPQKYVEFVAAHGCAGTAKQYGMAKRLKSYHDTIHRIAYEGKLLSLFLGDNVYHHGCQTEDFTNPAIPNLENHFEEVYKNRSGQFGFPWDRGFAILGNHDYNYINPLLRRILSYLPGQSGRQAHGPHIAVNQVLQSYALGKRNPAAYKQALLPDRYYAVHTEYAVFLCLDTNVLLFDPMQQIWLTQILQHIAEDPKLRSKYLVIVSHQPLQTGGKRSQDNGDLGYYACNLDKEERKKLDELILNLMPYDRDIVQKIKIPLSILLRRYLEREILGKGLYYELIISAHDHFNENLYVSFALQLIAGITGASQDPQDDARSEEEISILAHKKGKEVAVPVPMQSTQRMAETLPRPFSLPEETDELILPGEFTQNLSNVCFNGESIRPASLQALNQRVRLEITLPLIVFSPDEIKIIWQVGPAHNLQMIAPVRIPKNKPQSHLEFIRRILEIIEYKFGYFNTRLETIKPMAEAITPLRNIIEQWKRLSAYQNFLKESSKTQDAVGTIIQNIAQNALPLLSNLFQMSAKNLSKDWGFKATIQTKRWGEKAVMNVYRELHYIIMDMICLFHNLIEYQHIQPASTTANFAMRSSGTSSSFPLPLSIPA